jgi:hypothetical protein
MEVKKKKDLFGQQFTLDVLKLLVESIDEDKATNLRGNVAEIFNSVRAGRAALLETAGAEPAGPVREETVILIPTREPESSPLSKDGTASFAGSATDLTESTATTTRAMSAPASPQSGRDTPVQEPSGVSNSSILVHGNAAEGTSEEILIMKPEPFAAFLRAHGIPEALVAVVIENTVDGEMFLDAGFIQDFNSVNATVNVMHAKKLQRLHEKVLLSSKKPPPVHEGINAVDENGRTLLHLAAEHGHEVGIRCLLALGADINTKTAEGQTALEIAKKSSNCDNCIALLEVATASSPTV